MLRLFVETFVPVFLRHRIPTTASSFQNGKRRATSVLDLEQTLHSSKRVPLSMIRDVLLMTSFYAEDDLRLGSRSPVSSACCMWKIVIADHGELNDLNDLEWSKCSELAWCIVTTTSYANEETQLPDRVRLTRRRKQKKSSGEIDN